MGIISAGASLLSVAGNVAGTVLSLGSGAVRTGGKILSSKVGKLALGAGIVAVLASDPKKGGFFGKIKEGFSNLLGAITGKVKEAGTEAAVNVAAATMNAGENVNELAESVAEGIDPDDVWTAEADGTPDVAPETPESENDREYGG